MQCAIQQDCLVLVIELPAALLPWLTWIALCILTRWSLCVFPGPFLRPPPRQRVRRRRRWLDRQDVWRIELRHCESRKVINISQFSNLWCQQSFWLCHELEILRTIQKMPQNLYVYWGFTDLKKKLPCPTTLILLWCRHGTKFWKLLKSQNFGHIDIDFDIENCSFKILILILILKFAFPEYWFWYWYWTFWEFWYWYWYWYWKKWGKYWKF